MEQRLITSGNSGMFLDENGGVTPLRLSSTSCEAIDYDQAFATGSDPDIKSDDWMNFVGVFNPAHYSHVRAFLWASSVSPHSGAPTWSTPLLRAIMSTSRSAGSAGYAYTASVPCDGYNTDNLSGTSWRVTASASATAEFLNVDDYALSRHTDMSAWVSSTSLDTLLELPSALGEMKECKQYGYPYGPVTGLVITAGCFIESYSGTSTLSGIRSALSSLPSYVKDSIISSASGAFQHYGHYEYSAEFSYSATSIPAYSGAPGDSMWQRTGEVDSGAEYNYWRAYSAGNLVFYGKDSSYYLDSIPTGDYGMWKSSISGYNTTGKLYYASATACTPWLPMSAIAGNFIGPMSAMVGQYANAVDYNPWGLGTNEVADISTTSIHYANMRKMYGWGWLDHMPEGCGISGVVEFSGALTPETKLLCSSCEE